MIEGHATGGNTTRVRDPSGANSVLRVLTARPTTLNGFDFGTGNTGIAPDRGARPAAGERGPQSAAGASQVGLRGFGGPDLGNQVGTGLSDARPNGADRTVEHDRSFVNTTARQLGSARTLRVDQDRLRRATPWSDSRAAIVTFGLISACYTNLAFIVCIRRENGLLKRARGTPLSRSCTSAASSATSSLSP